MNKLILHVIVILLCTRATAQQAFNNTGNLQIHPGASITGFGNFTNTSTAGLVNNGSFYIKGNIINDQSSMASGLGTLTLNGTVAQSVNGTQSFKTYNLVTNNTAGFILNNNLSISALHTFTTGIISSSATPNYLVYEAGSSYTGTSDNGHVSGWVKKIGNTNFTFPVGNATVVRTVAVESLSQASEFNAHYYTPTSNTNNFLLPLLLLDPYEYWVVDRVSGGTAQVHLNWDKNKINFPDYFLTEVRVAYYTAGNWAEQGGNATGDVNATGDITSNVMNSFGSFTFGSTAFSLPLRFLHVAAERIQGNTLVRWHTAQEVNVDHFQVERSSNGIAFTAIGSIEANSTAAQYEFTDVIPLLGTAYYRIRSIDKDGKENLSVIVAVTEGRERPLLYVINNPVRNAIYLSASAAHKGTYKYNLYNAAGQVMQSGQLGVDAGIITIPVKSTLPAGIYTFDLRNGINQLTTKLIIQ